MLEACSWDAICPCWVGQGCGRRHLRIGVYEYLSMHAGVDYHHSTNRRR